MENTSVRARSFESTRRQMTTPVFAFALFFASVFALLLPSYGISSTTQIRGPTQLPAQQTSQQVIFFGGAASTQAQMDQWATRARADRQFGSQFDFRGIPLPRNGRGYNELARVNEATIAQWVRTIDDPSSANQVFVLAGHSNGSVLANEIARRVQNKNRIRFVTLDGFSPKGLNPQEVSIRCWGAQSSQDRNFVSRGQASMRTCGNTNHRNATSSTCRTRWCLHFAVVNRNVPPNTNGQNFPANGYANLEPNLDWLAPYASESQPQTPPPTGRTGQGQRAP